MTTRATATAMGDRVRGVAPDYKYYTAAEEEAKWVRKEAGGRAGHTEFSYSRDQ